MEGGTAPPVTEGLVLGAAAAAGGELGVATAAEAREGALVLAVGASQVEVELNVVTLAAASPPAMFMLGVEAFSEVSHTELELEFTDGAAGGFAAGWVELAGVVVFVVGTVGAAEAARGGVEDLGLSPAEGDEALTSSTGLVLFLWDLLFSPPFFFPPSPCIPG